MNIKYLLSFLFLFAIGLCNGQTILKGKTVDSESGIALAYVSISDGNGKTIATSDSNGNFEINKTGRYTFSKNGYQTLEKILTGTPFQIIQLDIDTSELSEVVINANYLPKQLKTSTASVSIISSKDIARSNNIDMAPVLNRVPGVFMQNGALNTNRITIRGIGARNLFGTAKIRAYFKDIPLTNGSGETTIEDFELGALSRFEINKGASSIFGAGLGGTIQLIPQNGYFSQSYINNELTVGSFGLFKALTNLNFGTKNSSYRVVYSHTESDGYRENNAYNRKTFTINTNHLLTAKDDISILAGYVDLKAFIPSSLNEDTYLNSPKSAAFTWKSAKGFEDAKRGILGLSWNHQFNKTTKQSSSLFTSFRDGYEPRPFNILDENTFAVGFRTRTIGNFNLFEKDLQWTLGGELFKDTYKHKTFENLYQDFPMGNGSVQGNPLSNFKEERSYYNLFFDTQYHIFDTTTLSFGFNFNQTAYRLEDRFPETSSNPDQSGTFKFNGIVSPKFGILQKVAKSISLFANVGHGFSPISLEETLLPDGQINTGLKPETGWNFELGTRGSAFKNSLRYSMSFFRLAIKNLLVSRRVAQDQFVGLNAGHTQHDGLELSLDYVFLQNETFSVNTFVSCTLNNFSFKQFVDGNNDFSGNDLTGVPSEVLSAGIDVTSKSGFYGNINFLHVGPMPITDANTLYSDAYSLTNFKLGYRKNVSEKIHLGVYFGINNVFDEKYASQILINASGFGGNAPRYFYPGNPFNFFTGVNINYSF